MLRPRRSDVLSTLLVVLLAAAILGTLRSASPFLYDYDGYFHIRYAEILRSEGISRSFPWWQETFLRDRFADKDFVYHLLLIPFTFGDLLLGAKVAAVVFATATLGIFHAVARRLRVPWPLAWALVLLASSTELLYRLGFTRPGVPAIAFLLAGTLAVFLGRAGWACAVAAVFVNAHVSFPLLPGVALLHDLHRDRDDSGRRSFRVFGWTVAGTVGGALLSPYVPNNLYMFWVQDVRALQFAWDSGVQLWQGWELLPGPSDELLKHNPGALAALGLGGYLLSRSKRVSPEAMTLLVMAGGFLALTLMSRRFIELFAPFAVLLLAVAVRDARDVRSEATGAPRVPARGRAALAVGVCVVVAALGVVSFTEARRWIARENVPDLGRASAWMKANIPEGETIFHTGWDDFAQLFFYNPKFRYLVGLDPTLMYATDPSRWRLWDDIYRGRADDPYTAIRSTFGCRWILARSKDPGLHRAARIDPRFVARYGDGTAWVFELVDGQTFASDWLLHGRYPDPARRLSDIRLPAEPAAPGIVEAHIPEAEGPAARGLEVEGIPGFVDLERLLGVSPRERDVCGVAESWLTADRAGDASVAVTTDDEFRVYLNGEKVLGASPFREPPPGSPGGPPFSLSDLPDTPRLPFKAAETTARVKVRKGDNHLVVKACRVGDEFGFFARAYADGGSPLPSAAGPSRP